MNLERRSFLRGLLVSASAAAGTALVKLAQPEDVKALVEQRETVVAQPVMHDVYPDRSWLSAQVFVETREGYQPIGYITELNVSVEMLDMTSWDGVVDLVPGVTHGKARFTRFGR